jgi:hypothetical protein
MLNETSIVCSGEEGHNVAESIAIAASVLLSLTLLASLYGIIWFERFGTDLKRTLIDQLFASVCWYLMTAVLFVQIPMTARIIFKGPFNKYVCAAINFTSATIYNSIIGKFDYRYF